MASTPELVHVKGVWERMRPNSPIYSFLLSEVEIISATKGTVTAQLTLGSQHVNSRGTIHGAVSATLVDWSGGLAIATYGLEKTGASIDIHVTYIGTAQMGETIHIEALANKVGRSVAFTTIRIQKLVNGKPGPMVATASHTKNIYAIFFASGIVLTHCECWTHSDSEDKLSTASSFRYLSVLTMVVLVIVGGLHKN